MPPNAASSAILGASVPFEPSAIAGRRADIQVLRGLAVLFVVFYHAGLGIAPRGYLGVDIFFVISGFLITKMIIEDIDRGRFSFRGFYLRRAKRLLPAAYCTFAIATLLASWLLLDQEYGQYLKQLIGAVTFTANIFLWRQTGYFDGAAELKPLLHTWSLSLEEQYYLLLPLFLIAISRRRRLVATGIAMCFSLACYAIVHSRSPDFAFFMLPTRAWELLIGSLCAMRYGSVSGPNNPVLMACSLAILLLVPEIDHPVVSPVMSALLVTTATAFLISGRYHVLEHRVVKPLSAVGDWSYSIYLVHWPLFALAANASVGAVGLDMRLALLCVSLVLGYLQYRWVEQTTRASAARPTRLFYAGVAASILLLMPVAHYAIQKHFYPARDHEYDEARRANYGLAVACESQGLFAPNLQCRTSPDPEYAVWGDSFAMHLLPGLRASAMGGALVQITRSACAPILGMAQVVEQGPYDIRWARSCVEFNGSVIEYLRETPSIKVVVLGATFAPFGTGVLKDGKLQKPSPADMFDGYAATIAAVRALGKKIVLVAPSPTLGFDRALCRQRLDTGHVILGRTSCDFSETEYRHARAPEIQLLGDLERSMAVAVLWPSDVLCKGGTCGSKINGKLAYRDHSHFSHEGSVEFANEFHLAEKIRALAK
jgi:peptidoglycan/LPS O-acetylase OafA/YrhL